MTKKVIMTNKGVKVGKGADTLLNLLLGANDKPAVKDEIGKIEYLNSRKEKIDIITDLSLCDSKGSNRLWEYVLENTGYMSGTVPIYLAADEAGTVDENILFELICEQCEKGVSVITIHPTVNQELLVLSKGRMIPCTSRGGGIVAYDYVNNHRYENIYLKLLAKIVQKCREHGVIISIGSTFRSGTIIDAMDRTYLTELEEQIKIADYLDRNGVSVMIETPGHIDPEKLLLLCEKIKDVPYPVMPLGPMLTDIGYEEDDTVAVIGASMMGICGRADILSIVTSREHLSGTPDIEEMKCAISKYQIARHIIDLHKIHNYDEDIRTAKQRANIKSCDITASHGCKRCGDVCPLRFDI